MPCLTPAKVASRPYCCAMVQKLINKATALLLATPRQQRESKCGMTAWGATLLPVPLPSVPFRSPAGLLRTFPRTGHGTFGCYLFCSRLSWLLKGIPGLVSLSLAAWGLLLALCAEPQWRGTVVILLDAAGKNKTVPSPEPSADKTWASLKDKLCPVCHCPTTAVFEL